MKKKRRKRVKTCQSRYQFKPHHKNYRVQKIKEKEKVNKH